MKLFDYQEKALALTSDKDNSAFYYDMGLGKTFIGSERLVRTLQGTLYRLCGI